MSAPTVWVVGATGLLGTSVVRALEGRVWRPERPVGWGDEVQLARDFRDAVAGFASRIDSEAGQPWAICWCAGAGVVATSAAALAAETRSFQLFLDSLRAESRLMAVPGYVVLASSAGGVYGGTMASPITEVTPPQPISDYGRAKLEQERMLHSWTGSLPKPVSSLVARLSNLYGPGQRLDKPQGLISQLSRASIFNAPVHVYVSLDTIRDYLFAEDAGRQLVAGLYRLMREARDGGLHVTKIYASEREITIAGLLGIFRRISRRRLRVIAGLHSASALQPRRLQFRSRVWRARDDQRERRVELVEGLSQVYRDQLVLFRRGLLPPPQTPPRLFRPPALGSARIATR
jgi:UDP-glucose 4-epimerase